MRLIFIEDDDYKAEQVRNYLVEEGHKIDIRGSFQSGMRAIISGCYDAVLLDMSIPTFDDGGQNKGNRHRPFGGKDVLQAMKRRELKLPVIVVTQYSVFGEGRDNISLQELEANLQREFQGIYQDMVYFDASSADWISKLKNLIRGLER